MIRYLYFVLVLFIAVACKEESIPRFLEPQKNINIVDDNYIVDTLYTIGDARRYGIYPNQKISQSNLKRIIDLSSKGLTVRFPKGYYDTSIMLDSVTNVSFVFDNATIAGAVVIRNKSNKIRLGGNITILDRLFVKNASHIVFDTLTVKTDTIQSLNKKENRGVSLYAGTKNLSITKLSIYNTGGTEDSFYKYTAAALQIHGWNNNPRNIFIKTLEIINADRTGLYITGSGHKINKAIITNFGLGSSKNMFGLEDAASGEEREFSGAWINRCNNCEIDSLIVNSTLKKGNYSLRLDEGKYHEPTFIYNVRLENNARNLPIKDDELTNILVKNEF